jgi:hypothetical protein
MARFLKSRQPRPACRSKSRNAILRDEPRARFGGLFFSSRQVRASNCRSNAGTSNPFRGSNRHASPWPYPEMDRRRRIHRIQPPQSGARSVCGGRCGTEGAAPSTARIKEKRSFGSVQLAMGFQPPARKSRSESRGRDDPYGEQYQIRPAAIEKGRPSARKWMSRCASRCISMRASASFQSAT